MGMYDDDDEELSSQEKAAILFIALGPEYTAKLLQHLDDDEIERITLEIANHKQVSAEQKAAVISEFYQMAMAKDYISTGGLEYAQNVLEKALGSEKALDIINRLKEYGIQPVVSDRWADVEVARKEYKVDLVPFEELPKADCVIVF